MVSREQSVFSTEFSPLALSPPLLTRCSRRRFRALQNTEDTSLQHASGDRRCFWTRRLSPARSPVHAPKATAGTSCPLASARLWDSHVLG